MVTSSLDSVAKELCRGVRVGAASLSLLSVFFMVMVGVVGANDSLNEAVVSCFLSVSMLELVTALLVLALESSILFFVVKVREVMVGGGGCVENKIRNRVRSSNSLFNCV